LISLDVILYEASPTLCGFQKAGAYAACIVQAFLSRLRYTGRAKDKIKISRGCEHGLSTFEIAEGRQLQLVIESWPALFREQTELSPL
jgi:hypothetical protein